MKDRFLREISYLRISITEKCNLCCTYCMGDQVGEGQECLESDVMCPGREQSGDTKDSGSRTAPELTVEELEEITEAAVSLGIHKIRITGGEPLMRPDVVEICERIHAIPGVKELVLTTNGVLLKQYADKLKRAGVSRLNISLDTLREDRYRAITRRGDIKTVLEGIQGAKAAGLLPIKLNVVLLKGINEDEISDFVELTRAEPMEVRFIELMPIGAGIGSKEQYLSGEAVLQAVPELVPDGNGGVAQLYRLPEGKGRVGIISPVSRHFCPTCNRIRLTCDGHLKPCLHTSHEIDIRHLRGMELREAMRGAILQKPMEHEDFKEGKISGAGRSMREIGG